MSLLFSVHLLDFISFYIRCTLDSNCFFKARCKVITNVRKPYDASASHYELIKWSIVEAICNTVNISMLIRHYSRLGPKKVFVLACEDIVEQSKDLICRISKFVGVDSDKKAVGVITNKIIL